MRIQLHSKRVQTSLREVFLQTLQTHLSGNIVIVIVICLPGAQNQPIDEPVPEKHAPQRLDKKPDSSQAIPFTNSERGAYRPQEINIHSRHKRARKKRPQTPPPRLLAERGVLPLSLPSLLVTSV